MCGHKLTPKKIKAFLESLIEYGNVSHAAKQIDMARSYMYEYRDKDEAFKAAWDEAVDISVEAMEKEARRRAVEGVEEPVFYQGDECGTIRKYSDTLLIFLLKAHKPEKYKERTQQDVNLSYTEMTDDELIERAKGLLSGVDTAGTNA